MVDRDSPGRVARFEELIAWQKARDPTREVYKATEQGTFARDFGLRDQIRRASVSIMSNLAEGYERGTRPEFHRVVTIAKASCAEVRTQLYIALDVGHLTEVSFRELMKLAEEVGRIIGGLRASLEQSTARR